MQKKLKLWAGRLFLFMVINSLVFTSPSLSAAASFPDIGDHWAKEYIRSYPPESSLMAIGRNLNRIGL